MSSPYDPNANRGQQGQAPSPHRGAPMPPPQGQPYDPQSGQPQGQAYNPRDTSQGMPYNPQSGPQGPGASQAPMSSSTPAHSRLPKPLEPSDKKNIPFGRLVSVELRKEVDTRAGKWLIGLTVVLILVVSSLVAYNTSDSPSYWDLVGACAIPLTYLLPILGILTVTSEWSQRTGLNTFTLEPRRSAVLFAKWVAGIILAIIALVVSLAMAALFTMLAGVMGSGSPDWNVDAKSLFHVLVFVLLYVSMGIAFGAFIQNTPGAICAYLFIPMVISMLNLFSWARTSLEWANPSQTFSALTGGSDNMIDNMWPKIAVSALIWIALPMVLGFIRVNQREIKTA